MSPFKRLLEEVHNRSIWQILLIYLGSGWVILQITDQLVQQYLLPAWVYRGAFILILVGLPIVLATAFVERGISAWKRHHEADAPGAEVSTAGQIASPDAGAATGSAADTGTGAPAYSPHRFLTWRRALLGGVGAFALLGLLTLGFFLSRALGVGPGASLIAQGVLADREPIILAQFENRTQDSLLATAITEALRVDLAQSSAVTLVEPDRIKQAMGRMEVSEDAALDRDLAREVALREGVKAVISGTVTPVGSSYVITASVVAAESGEDLVSERQTADDADAIIEAVDQLSNRLRAGVGESLGSVLNSPPLPRVTTTSLDALKLYAQSLEHQRRGEPRAAIGVLERAVTIDTAFAGAYRGLAIYYGNIGDPARAQENIDRAYLHSQRLADAERYKTAASFHSYRAVWDSAATYYQLLIDTGSEDFAVINNLGDLYERMGRYDEALPLYRRAVEVNPTITGHLNLASVARSTGNLALADSAVEAMRAINPDSWQTRQQWGWNLYFKRDWERLQEAATTWRQQPQNRWDGTFWLAVLEAAHGHIERAIPLADSSFDDTLDQGSPFYAFWTVPLMTSAGLAGDRSRDVPPYLERHKEAELLAGAPMFQHIALSWVALGYAKADDLTAASGVLAHADSLKATGDFHALGVDHLARAFLALSEGRPEEALGHVERAREADFGMLHHLTRYALADALERLGRLPEAAAHYDTLTSMVGLNFTDAGVYGPLLGPSHERAARTFMAAGDTTAALRHLAAFVELWADADPDLQPRVDAAQAQLEEILRVRG
jgi:tetratricopeptide (TPR) repeat protein